MASFESPVKLDPSNPKNPVSLMEFGLTWLQKKQSSETQKVVAVLLVLQGKRRLLSDGPLQGMFLQNLLDK